MNAERQRFVAEQIADAQLELDTLLAGTIARDDVTAAFRRSIAVNSKAIRIFMADAPALLAPYRKNPMVGVETLRLATRALCLELSGVTDDERADS